VNALNNDFNLLGDASRAFLGQEHKLRIAGKHVASSGGGMTPLVDPSSGEIVGHVPEATPGDVDAAVRAARVALEDGPWARMRPHERALAMSKLADLIEQNGRELAELETINSGRLIANTRIFDVEFSAHVLRYMSGWATKIEGRTVDISAPYMPAGEFFSFTTREPIGVVAGIVPWNVPLCQAVWKLAPALAAGCTVVLKPAEPTPLTALRLADLAVEAGIPAGVVNVVTGSGAGAGAALATHPGVDKISFTGSTTTGKIIATHAAGAFKKYNLELGGKSPVVIMPDADLEKAIPGAAWAIFGNHGQNCCAGSRLYVHESLFDKVLEGVAEIARSIRLGPGLDPASQMGRWSIAPSNSASWTMSRPAGAKVRRCLPAARRSIMLAATFNPRCSSIPRNRCVWFGRRFSARFWWPRSSPTRQKPCNWQTIPISVLAPASGRVTSARVHRFIKGFKAGNVWVNVHNILDTALPFGGAKNSGVGYDLGEQSVLDHTRIKAAVISL
jgi:phenylacetaldehyde dehydrogenase